MESDWGETPNCIADWQKLESGYQVENLDNLTLVVEVKTFSVVTQIVCLYYSLLIIKQKHKELHFTYRK